MSKYLPKSGNALFKVPRRGSHYLGDAELEWGRTEKDASKQTVITDSYGSEFSPCDLPRCEGSLGFTQFIFENFCV